MKSLVIVGTKFKKISSRSNGVALRPTPQSLKRHRVFQLRRRGPWQALNDVLDLNFVSIEHMYLLLRCRTSKSVNMYHWVTHDLLDQVSQDKKIVHLGNIRRVPTTDRNGIPPCVSIRKRWNPTYNRQNSHQPGGAVQVEEKSQDTACAARLTG